MGKNKLELLQTALSNLIVVQPPERILVNHEAFGWFEKHGIVFPHMWLPSGVAQGFNREGTDAIKALTFKFREERTDYQRSTDFTKFAYEVATVVISDYADNLDKNASLNDVISMEKRIEEWFIAQTMARTFLVPCSIIPEHASAFTIGTVSFLSIRDLIVREQLQSGNPEDHITYGPLLRTMRERSAYWLAEIKIEGLDEGFGTEKADLAVDVALVAIQMSIPVSYSREMARITGRTMPSRMGSVYKTDSHVHSGSQRRDPGLGFSADIFDQYRLGQVSLLNSVGNRVNSYIGSGAKLPKLDQSWSDAAYWFHEGLAEPLDTIAIAKLETAIEVLLSAESAKGSAKRFREAFKSFYGLDKSQPIADGSARTVDQFITSIVGARSRVLHGTSSTLTPDTLTNNEYESRSEVELLAMDLLQRFTFMLDEYEILPTAMDDVATFLKWIDLKRTSNQT